MGRRTGGDVELPAMPRAGNLLAGNIPFRKRSTPVGAGIIEGVKVSTDIEDRDIAAIQLNFLRGTFGNVGFFEDLMEIRHGTPPEKMLGSTGIEPAT